MGASILHADRVSETAAGKPFVFAGDSSREVTLVNFTTRPGPAKFDWARGRGGGDGGAGERYQGRRDGRSAWVFSIAMPVGSLSVRSPPAEKVDLWPEQAAADLEGLGEARCQLNGTRWGTHPDEQQDTDLPSTRVSSGSAEPLTNQVLPTWTPFPPVLPRADAGPFVDPPRASRTPGPELGQGRRAGRGDHRECDAARAVRHLCHAQEQSRRVWRLCASCSPNPAILYPLPLPSPGPSPLVSPSCECAHTYANTP